MPGIGIAVVVLAVVGFIGFAIWWDYYSNKKRTEALRPIAEELGFSFSAKADNSLVTQLGTFNLISQGHAKTVQDLLQSADGHVRVLPFDSRYSAGSGKNQHTTKK